MSVWDSRRVLITGGLGFTGSNLVRRLVNEGANVTLLDVIRSGEKLTTVEDIRSDVRIVDADIRNTETVARQVADADIIYHLAAKTSRPEANKKPRENLGINCGGPLNVLEPAAAVSNPPHFVYVSTLAVFGNALRPVDETSERNPVDVYGIHKRTVEDYCQLYHRIKNVPTTVVRPANLYGPRAPLSAKGYGIINEFVGNALRDESLTIFEPSDLREFLYIDDMVNALLCVGQNDRSIGEDYVLGTGKPLTMKQAAEMVIEISGSGTIKSVPWPDTWEQIRRDDVATDSSKMERDLGWSASVSLEEGLKRTIDFYRTHEDVWQVRS